MAASRAAFRRLHERSAIMVEMSNDLSAVASAKVHGLQPTINTPDGAVDASLRRRASGAVVSPNSTTVASTIANVKAGTLLPSKAPWEINTSPNTAAVATATTPRGATQPMSSFSRQVKLVKTVLASIATGLRTKIRKATKA